MSAAQNPWPPIGQLFVERGHLTAEQLEGALAEQRGKGGHLGEILVARGLISRLDLAGALSAQWGWQGDVPVAAAPELVPVPALPATDPPPTYPSPSGAPWDVPTFADLEGDAASQPSPTPSITGLEDQERLLRELQAHLREAHEQLAAGEARLGVLEAILPELSQAYAALNARLDAQTREIEDLRRVAADQATRIATAGRALVA